MSLADAGNTLAKQPEGVVYSIIDSDTVRHLMEDGSDISLDDFIEYHLKLTRLRTELDQDVGAARQARRVTVRAVRTAGAVVMPGMRVDSLIVDGEQVVGVRAGDEELRAHVVVAADGVNSFLAQDAGIRAKEPTKHPAVGMKSVVKLPAEVIEDRFNLTGNQGATYAVVGDRTLKQVVGLGLAAVRAL